LRRLEGEGRPAGPGEQAVLARWSGWGALPAVFDTRETAAAREMADVRAELRRLLSEEEWRAASASTLNAHYTDARIVAACWELLERLGFRGGWVLEPGCGSGNFLGLVPDRLAGAADLVGVEVEPITAGIAAALYPHAEIRCEGFETSRFPAAFDAAVGNVPFGEYMLHDPAHNPARLSVHNHFLLKTVDLLAPGGVAVMVTSTWTLDARNPAARRHLHAQADLLGAIRLPSGPTGQRPARTW
jgi:SAM-dependent methyltransferase